MQKQSLQLLAQVQEIEQKEQARLEEFVTGLEDLLTG